MTRRRAGTIISELAAIGFLGTAALHSSLASCAQGVSVVNIDNGFGAACAVVRMLSLLDRPTTR